ncbi:MAG: CRISPR-associated endonuclease Cas1 [Roseiarcus sp.]
MEKTTPVSAAPSADAPAGAGPPVSPERDPLFFRATSVEQLWRAWERVRANHGAAGGDGVTIERFAPFAKEAIEALAKRLRGFTYRPGPSRRVMIPKRAGGFRPLDIPCVVDRVAQGAAALTLVPALEPEFEDSSFAYRPGRGVADAVRRVAALRRQGYTHAVDADIAHYFETVPHEPLLAKLEKLVGDDAILDLVALWLEHHAPNGVGLPQGSPLSPLLANLYLDALDEAVEGRGVRLVRYADDFVILAKSEGAARDALSKVTRLLAEHGLTLNAEKTRVVDFDQGFRFLGHLFVRSLVLREIAEEDAPTEDAIATAEAALAASPAEPGDARADEAAPREPHGPGFRVLYVMEPGRKLTIEGEAFAVREGEATVLLVPHRRVGRVELGPAVEFDAAALDLAAAAGIEVCRINGHGETVGRWSGEAVIGARARRHFAQAALAADPARRLELARILVEGRVRNQRALLRRVNATRKDADVVAAAVAMNRVLRRLREPKSVEAAMGYEGEAGALFWPALARGLDYDVGFSGKRRRRPAGSPFDAILNALASLVTRDVRIALLRRGLHPGFAVLHTPEDGEDALVYDVMEEFRAPLIEATALALVNRRAVTREMFEAMPGGQWRMNRDAWQAVVRGHEAAAARPVASPARGGLRVSWRAAMEDQAGLFAAHCEGQGLYAPLVLDY